MKKATVYRVSGGKTSEISLPIHFAEPIRPDLIKRAVLALQNSRRQPYGSDPLAGKRQGYTTPKRRRKFKTTYGKGISRIRRKHLWTRGNQFGWVGAFVASATGGRKAFPPLAEKVLVEKINKKERRKAIRSAIAATKSLIIDNKLEELNKTKDVKQTLTKNELNQELQRTKKRKIRAGAGTMRGRKYRTKSGILLVVSKACPLMIAAENLPGIEVSIVDNLNAELLAPGSNPGRTTIWSKAAIERLSKEKLFI
tara:strand:- start:226 stop:987 length:762 start_codon:yes stop_codon:yes gene_type:complete